jgi:hypothetical protein
MSENKREAEVKFDDKKKAPIKIYVKKPNNDLVKRADRCRAKAWNECIVDGIITKKELSALMKKRGIWSETKEDEQDAITDEINRLEQKLYLECGKRASRKEEGKGLAIDIRKQRNKLRELISEKMSLEENTAEALADNSRFDFLVCHCTYHENDVLVYNDMEDYNSKSSDEIAFTAASELASMIYALDSDFEKNLPENRWLTNRELVNEDLALVNEDKKRVDVEGRVIDENGYYLDDKGERIDKSGHRLSKDGFYEEVDDEDQLKPTRKRATKKENHG